jgi:hypothetical protein
MVVVMTYLHVGQEAAFGSRTLHGRSFADYSRCAVSGGNVMSKICIVFGSGHAEQQRFRPYGDQQLLAGLDEVAVELAWLNSVAADLDPRGGEGFHARHSVLATEDTKAERDPVSQRSRAEHGDVEQTVVGLCVGE